MCSASVQIAGAVVLLLFSAACRGLDYDANDFAAEVLEYVEGSGVGRDPITGNKYDNPVAALGRATLLTTGEGWDIPVDASVPVVPVYQAFRAFELVTVGSGGHLVVVFNHRVADDENNPYGIDFIVYGNAFIGGDKSWENGNPEATIVSEEITSEPGIVSVSQDALMWYSFSEGPYADDFAPTAAFEWDDVNDVWGRELDPLRPVDPNLGAFDLDGRSVAEVIRAYKGSAGGTGFDISESGLEWIRYLRIDSSPSGSVTTEIDAIADVSCCGDYRHPYPQGDFNQDCRVDMLDLAAFGWDWLGDDWAGFGVMAANWLDCTWQCE